MFNINKLISSRGAIYRVFIIMMLVLLPAFSWANPVGGEVAAGNATINQTPGNTQINQTSDRAVINWQGFSIGAGEKTQFTQPGSGSITLNRVTTANNPSNILGKLSANGQVWLINPAGIVFAKGSQVNVAGLLATTANIKDSDFMAGRFHFIQDPKNTAGIINNGEITVQDRGLVALVAPGVANNGKIVARLGKVTLASGSEFTVDLHGDQLIQFSAGTSQTPTDPLTGLPMKNAVANHGKIYADGGQVVLSAETAEHIVDNAVNMDGLIQARSVGAQNGKVILAGGSTGTVHVHGGTIDVSGLNSGETGGVVQVTGKTVLLTSKHHHNGTRSDTYINASGNAGGGEVDIGGNLHGQGNLQQATYTTVSKHTTINADATNIGNGGVIAIWSNVNDPNSITKVHGTLTAKGGLNGGNGGLVETSGYRLDANGAIVNTMAQPGKGGTTGTWLIDPVNIYVIAPFCTNGNALGCSAYTQDQFDGTTNSYIDTATLANNLGTSNVLIDATAAGTGTGIIRITSAIDAPDTTNSLTFQSASGQPIVFMSDTNGNSGSINIGGDINFNGAVSLTAPSGGLAGSSYLAQAVNITSAQGSITFNSTLDGDASSDVTPAINAVTVSAANGTVDFAGAVGGNVNLASLQVTGATTIGADIITSGAQTYNSAVNLTAADTTLVSTGGNITFASTVTGTGNNNNLTVSAGSDLSINGNVSVDGSLTLSATDDLQVANNVGLTSFNSMRLSAGQSLSLGTNDVLLSYGTGSTAELSSQTGMVIGNGTAIGSDIQTTLDGGGGDISLTNASLCAGVSGGCQATIKNTDNLTITNGLKIPGAALNLQDINTINLVGGVIGEPGVTTVNGSAATVSVQFTAPGTVNQAQWNQVYGLISAGGTLQINSNENSPGSLASSYGDIVIPTTVGLVNFNDDGTGIVLTGFQTTSSTAVALLSDTQFIQDLNTPTGFTFGSTLDGAHSLVLNGATTFQGDVGGQAGLTSLQVNGTTTIGGAGNITTSGAQTYNGAVDLNASDTTLTSISNNITFASTVTGNGNNLTISTGAGTTTLDGSKVSGINNLTTNGAGTIGLINSLTTQGTQNYNNAVVLGGDTNLNGDAINFNSTLDGAYNLVLNGDTTFQSDVGSQASLASLQVNGTTTIAGTGNITTSGAQTYNGAVSLDAVDTTLTSTNSNINFTSIAGNNNNLTVSVGAGIATFDDSYISDINNLTTEGSGITRLENALTTQGTQNYNNAVMLGSDVNLTGNAINFNSTLDGPYNLVLNGATTFQGNVGSQTNLVSLQVNGTTTINGDVSTTGAQIYNNAVTLGERAISLSGDNILFNATVDGHANLTLNGPATFNGAVGGLEALNSLSITGETNLNGGLINTVGDQTYARAVILGAATTLSSSNGAITLNTVNGNQTLNVASAYVLNLNNAINVDIDKLSGNAKTVNINNPAVTIMKGQQFVANQGNLNVTAGNYAEDVVIDKNLNLSAVNGAVAVTSLTANNALGLGGQWLGNVFQFNDVVNLINNTDLLATAGNIIFNSTIDGKQNLAMDASGIIQLAGAVGANTSLASFTTTSLLTAGTIAINAGRIFISGLQATDAYLNGTDSIFANVVVDALTLNGRNGGTVNGSIGGFSGPRASLLAHLAGSALGYFMVNGCLLPGGCSNNTVIMEPQQLVQKSTEKPIVCTMGANGTSSGDCGAVIALHHETTSAL